MSKLLLILVFLVFSFSAYTIDQAELSRLNQEFQQEVSNLQMDQAYSNWVCRDAFLRFRTIESASRILAPQYFVYVDRNPTHQNIFIGFYDSSQQAIYKIGWDKVSTGNPKRKGHFITPTGVFANSIANVGYRALGTKNSKGWRGLGGKGSRVWDFGWQWTNYTYNNQLEPREIRLLLHATDPDFGEPRLGRPDSKGCIRISARLNQFLDQYGLLDAAYEANRQEFSWLLSPSRQPAKFAGRYLMVGDSTSKDPASLVAQLTP